SPGHQTRGFELTADVICGPICSGIGCVVQKLTHHFTTKPCIRATLDLDKGRDRILIQKKVIERPTASATILTRYGDFASYEKPSPRACTVDLVSCKERWISRE